VVAAAAAAAAAESASMTRGEGWTGIGRYADEKGLRARELVGSAGICV